MLTPHDFRTVRAAIVERNSSIRSEMRAALLEKGIREPATCKTADAFLDLTAREVLDLVVCDSSAFGGEFSPEMQRIRRSAEGGNPFVVVIATVNEATLGQVQNVLSGGVDDLVRRPVAAKKVVDRIDYLVRNRKPFIATQGYVGPTRGKQARAGDGGGVLVEVPNTLRSKVVDKVSHERLRRQVARASAKLKDRIAEHPLEGVDRLIRRAIAWQGGSMADLRGQFGKLHTLSLEMSGHYQAPDDIHIADLTLALSKLANRIANQTATGPQRVDLDLLSHLGGVVRGTMSSPHQSQAVVREIAAVVERYTGGFKPIPALGMELALSA